MSQLVVKIVAIFCLLLLTLGAALLPFKIGQSGAGRRQRILSLSNCFAGGVFLATSLLDLLPMVEEKFKAVFNEDHITTVFPVAEFTTCVGFFLVLILEQFIHTFHEQSFLHGHNHHHDVKAPLLDGSASQIRSVENGPESSVDSFATRSSTKCNSSSAKEHQTEGFVRTYILVFALSLHSIFEGLALGLITEVDRLIQITVAVLMHKSIIAFSMGVNMVQHKMPLGTLVKAAAIFSIMGPIGMSIGIGILDYSSQRSSNLASGILQGIANGTFIYVTFFEILQSELSRKGNRLLKVLFMIIGFSIVTGLLYYANILENKSSHLHGTHNSTVGLYVPM